MSVATQRQGANGCLRKGRVMTDYGLTDKDRADLHARLVSWFGDDRQAFLVSHLAPVVDRIKSEACAQAAAEAQWNALEMARKADQAERRAEGTEAELERLKAAADLVGHQAACLVDPCDCWMSDLAPLLDYERTQWAKVAEVEQGEGADTWTVAAFKEQPREHASDCACWPPYDSCSHPAHPPCACDGCIGAQCDHQWIDRPESDTVLCDLCGAER